MTYTDLLTPDVLAEFIGDLSETMTPTRIRSLAKNIARWAAEMVTDETGKVVPASIEAVAAEELYMQGIYHMTHCIYLPILGYSIEVSGRAPAMGEV